MSDEKYRVALYKAIDKAMIENEKYVGSVEQDENGEYYVLHDTAQELAILKYEKMQEKYRTEKEEKVEKGEER